MEQREINLDTLFANKHAEPTETVLVVEEQKYVDFGRILNEVSYKLPKGYPTVVDGVFTEREEIIIINEALEAEGLSTLPLPEITAPTNQVLSEATTADNSEVLCMYFCSIPETALKICKDHLKSLKKTLSKPKKALVISGLNATNLGTNGNTALTELIANYNAGNPNVKEFVNAITSAQYIRDSYGVIKPSQLDRGNRFAKVKTDAVKFIKNNLNIDIELDKWSPADFFIYNDGAPKSIDINKNTTLIDINNLFTEDISNDSGKIVGISLKQSQAQGGKALSFRNTLTRDQNFKLADEITPEQKEERSCLYLGVASTSTAKSGTRPIKDSDKFGYIAEVAITKKLTKDPDWLSVKSAATNTIKNTVKNALKQYKAKERVYQSLLLLGNSILQQNTQAKAKKVARTFFNTAKINTIVYGDYDNLVTAFISSKKKKAEKICKQAKDDFLNALVTQDYVPIDRSKGDDADSPSLRLYKKASCYVLATWFLTGAKTKALRIPSGFTAIANQQDPFIAMTAYAISQAGVSPYFIKVQGAGNKIDKLDSQATAYFMGGDGMIQAQKNKAVKIIDSSGAAGFAVELELEVKKTKGAGKKYKVTLDFRFAGEVINIEVQSIH